MDNSKATLDELFQYGNKILSALKDSAAEKSTELDDANHRYNDLRQDLKNLLDKHAEVN